MSIQNIFILGKLELLFSQSILKYKLMLLLHRY